MRQAPLGQLHVVVLDGGVQEPSRARPIAAGVEHLPFRIGPVRGPARSERVLVDQLEKPEDLAVEMDVVDDLSVVRVGAPLEKEPHQRITLLMRGPALFAFPDRAGERRVPAAAGHEIHVGIGAMVQECARDRDGVPGDRRQRQPREGQVRERLPAFQAPVFPGQIQFATRASSLGTRFAVPPGRPTRVGREGAIHRVEIAADDSRIEVRGRYFRMASQEAHRRVPGADVIGSPAHVMVGAGVVEEERYRFHDLPPKVREVGNRGSSGFHRVPRGATGFCSTGFNEVQGSVLRFRAEPCRTQNPEPSGTRWNRTSRNPVEPCGTQ